MALKDILADPNSPARVLGGAQPFYVSGEDHLQVRVFNTAAVTLGIVGRMLMIDGRIAPFAESFTPATSGALDTKIIALPEGWLLNVAVIVTNGTPTVSNCLALLRVVHGLSASAQALGTLAQGQVTASSEVTWPLSSAVASSSAALAGIGLPRIIVGTNPAANTEITETVPAGKIWRLRSIRFTFVCSAAVANREVVLLMDDGANIISNEPIGVAQTASQTFVYTFGHHAPTVTGAQAIVRAVPIPDFLLPAGARFRTSTSNMDVADDYSAPNYHVEEWSV